MGDVAVGWPWILFLKFAYHRALSLGIQNFQGVPRTQITWRSKNWFEEEVKKKRKELSQLGRWKMGERWKDSTGWENWKQKRSEYFRSIRLKKKEMWDRFMGEAKTNEEMWGVRRYSLKKRCQKIPTLEHKGSTATTFREKEEIRRENVFPGAPASDEAPHQQDNGKQVQITTQEVRRSFKNSGPFKGLGEDKIAVKAIKETMSETVGWVRETYKVAINNGRPPKERKRAMRAIIPKPGKSKYRKVKSY